MTRLMRSIIFPTGLPKCKGTEDDLVACPRGAEENPAEEPPVRTGKEALDAYCINLNEKAKRKN